MDLHKINFWKRLEMFAKDVQVNDAMSEEEKEMIVRIAQNQQKLNIARVSGKTEVCPDCRTKNLHHMGHGAWVCAFCGNNGKPMACASGAVDKTVSDGCQHEMDRSHKNQLVGKCIKCGEIFGA